MSSNPATGAGPRRAVRRRTDASEVVPASHLPHPDTAPRTSTSTGPGSAATQFTRTTPPERFEPEAAIPLAEVDSLVPQPWLRGDRRFDPYWDGLWGSSAGASWIDAPMARRQRDAGLARMPKALAAEAEPALARFLGDPDAVTSAADGTGETWGDRLAWLGALFGWRTMSAQQAAAITGIAPLAHPTRDLAAASFACGLVEMGVFGAGLISTSLASRSAAYRPTKSKVFDKHIEPNLTWPELVSVTGGQPWAAGTHYDRHNILATELALRACEYTEIGRTGTVLGERFSTLDMLTGTPEATAAGGPAHTPRSAADAARGRTTADLTLVRRDGLRIAVEMTANTGTHFAAKVKRWAKAMEENPIETNGLIVLFVLIDRPERRASSSARAETYSAILSAVRAHPGNRYNRIAERMAVATWREWFPADHALHPAFFGLRADRPTGRARAEDPTGAGRWESADLLDTDAVPFTPTAAMADALLAPIANSALLGQTPRFVRERILASEATRPAPLWPMLLVDAGRDLTHAPVPDPVPARANRPMRRAPLSLETLLPPPRLLGSLAWSLGSTGPTDREDGENRVGPAGTCDTYGDQHGAPEASQGEALRA